MIGAGCHCLACQRWLGIAIADDVPVFAENAPEAAFMAIVAGKG